MKFIKVFIVVIFVFICYNKWNGDVSDTFSGYKAIVMFANRIKPTTGLRLCAYNVNGNLPKDYQFTNSIATFSTDYALYYTRQDTVSLDRAREWIVSLTESWLKEINSSPIIRNDLENYPFSGDLLRILIRFKDENQIELGTGICSVYLCHGKIKYKHYEISKYTGRYPALGKHSVVHEETYAEALDIVKKAGTLVDF